MSELRYLKKVMRVRRKLMAENLSQKPTITLLKALKKFDIWLTLNKKCSDLGAFRMINKYSEEFLCIMPGKECKAHEKFMREFNLIKSKNG